jgi:hypothetical protein
MARSPGVQPGVQPGVERSEDARVGPGGDPRVLDATTRWRCGGCGNLTRFDVTRQARRREYWHFDLAGEPRVEEAETLTEDVLEVACRWCGRNDAIERVPRPDQQAESDDGAL